LFMAIHRNDITKRNTLLGELICFYYKAMAKSAGIPLPVVLEEKLKKASYSDIVSMLLCVALILLPGVRLEVFSPLQKRTFPASLSRLPLQKWTVKR